MSTGGINSALCAFCGHITCLFGTLGQKVIPLERSITVALLTTAHANGLSWVNVAIATKRYGILLILNIAENDSVWLAAPPTSLDHPGISLYVLPSK